MKEVNIESVSKSNAQFIKLILSVTPPPQIPVIFFFHFQPFPNRAPLSEPDLTLNVKKKNGTLTRKTQISQVLNWITDLTRRNISTKLVFKPHETKMSLPPTIHN